MSVLERGNLQLPVKKIVYHLRKLGIPASIKTFRDRITKRLVLENHEDEKNKVCLSASESHISPSHILIHHQTRKAGAREGVKIINKEILTSIESDVQFVWG